MWIFNCDSWQEVVIGIFVRVFIIFMILPIHEYAHAWAAEKLGDNTAKNAGRLTLNPIAHIDWIGAAAIMFVGFGWAKPVPVNPYRFDDQKHRKRGMALTALAGPGANLLVSLVALIILRALACISFQNVYFMFYLTYGFYYLIYINITLAVFNMIPIYPLDGSRILAAFLPDKYEYFMQRYGQIISLAFIALIIFGVLDGVISFLAGGVANGITWLVDSGFDLIGLGKSEYFAQILQMFGLTA